MNTYEDYLNLIRENKIIIEHIPKQYHTRELKMEMLKYNSTEFRSRTFIEDSWYELCLEAVKQNPWLLEYVPEKHKKYRIFNEALKRNGLVLKYVDKKHQSESLCLIAVKQNGKALEYVYDKTPKICLEALRQLGLAADYVNEEGKMIFMSLDKNQPVLDKLYNGKRLFVKEEDVNIELLEKYYR